MTKKELQEFRAKLVKAKSFVSESCRAYGPLSEALIQGNYCIAMHTSEISFFDWCYTYPLSRVRAMYDNSIADLDKRIARMK